MFVSVVIDLKTKQLDQLYDYFVPKDLEDLINIGTRVVVSFGNLTRIAYVIEIIEESDKASKPIIEVLDPIPLLSDELIEIYYYLKEHTTSLKSVILDTLLPSEYQKNYQNIAQLIKPFDSELINKFDKNGIWTLKKEDSKYYNKLKTLEKDGYITLKTILEDKLKPKTVKIYSFNYSNNYPRINNYSHVVELFKQFKSIKREHLLDHISISSINTLVKNDVLIEDEIAEKRIINYQYGFKDIDFDLNVEQIKALNELKKGINSTNKYLLYGLTGSGKTEVYINLVKEVIKHNKKALILVPEINMISQVYQRLQSENINTAVIHSALTPRERFDQYDMIYFGSVDVILGTRSAVFAPINNLGVIIMDEEQDESYIQTEQAIYDTREIVNIRSKYHNSPILYVSATPKIETMFQANSGEIKLLTLSKKAIVKDKPEIKFVSLKEELKKGNTSILSTELVASIKETLSKNEQVIVLVNRKGYSPFVMCRTCGYVPKCPNCNISLTYYKENNELKCHYCGYKEDYTNKCPSCNNDTLSPRGIAIEYVISELKKYFSDAKILQMDQSTTRRKGAHEKLWFKFLKNDADILVGTQMVAKAFDFPEVTLVAVIMADHDIKLATYNADEKTYILLEQLIGRAGRHKPGKAIIQGYNLDHFAIQSLLKDYDNFYTQALVNRKLGNYPPFVKMGQIIASGPGFLKTYQALFKFKESLMRNDIIVLGPNQAKILKRGNDYRFKITLKYQEKQLPLIVKLVKEIKKNDIRFTFTPFIDLE